MRGGGGGGGGSGGFSGSFATSGSLTGILGSGFLGRGAAPNSNKLRSPPSTVTSCNLARRSRRRVGSIELRSGRSLAFFGFREGWNACKLLLRDGAARGVRGAVVATSGRDCSSRVRFSGSARGATEG